MKLSLATSVLSLAVQNLVRASAPLLDDEKPPTDDENPSATIPDRLLLDREHIVEEIRKPRFVLQMIKDRVMNHNRRHLQSGRAVDSRPYDEASDVDEFGAATNEEPDTGLLDFKLQTSRDLKACAWYNLDVRRDCCYYADENVLYQWWGRCGDAFVKMCENEREWMMKSAFEHYGALFEEIGCSMSCFDEGLIKTRVDGYCELVLCAHSDESFSCKDDYVLHQCNYLVDLCAKGHASSCFMQLEGYSVPEDGAECVPDDLLRDDSPLDLLSGTHNKCHERGIHPLWKQGNDVSCKSKGKKMGGRSKSAGGKLNNKVALETVATTAMVGGGAWLI